MIKSIPERISDTHARVARLPEQAFLAPEIRNAVLELCLLVRELYDRQEQHKRGGQYDHPEFVILP